MRIDGSCHCGAITFAADVDPARVSICHCTDCQTLTGSPFRVTLLCARDDIRIDGTPARYRKTGQSGRGRLMYFCRECATPLFSSRADEAGEWGIRWGAVHQRSTLIPARQIWTQSAVSWIDRITQLTDGGNP